ncbi:MAG TPA: Gfo/Idh/MocA family oxidoreductase [Fimbriimonadaceae bacterium]|nr:Gfo/Idh/MocA family oxidoreductase [Fimbriimonadaceae bacterium]
MDRELSRREVLAGTFAFALTPRSVWANQDRKPVGWAILGIGSYAQNQIMPSFAACKNAKLVGLISGTPSKLETFGERYGIPKGYRYSYDQMDAIKDNPEIEVVYVITPPSTHPEFAIRAAQAGKHVCCEKPMAPTAAECQRMIDECRKAGKLMQIGYRSHYEAHNMRAIEMCRKGELGKIKSFRSDHGFNIGRGQWRTKRALAGGGSMMDIGIYSLQALRYLSGEEPVEVMAKITNPPNDDRFVDCEDDVQFTLKLPSGIECSGGSGYSWRPGKSRFEVVGEKGVLLGEPATPYGGHRLALNGEPLPITANNQFAAQMDHFSDCIRNGGKVRTPGEEGLQDIRIVQAIYESAASGKAVRINL